MKMANKQPWERGVADGQMDGQLNSWAKNAEEKFLHHKIIGWV